MTSTPWRIVPLTAEHARGLAECHIACWREAYRGLIPDHVLDAFDIDHRARQWERIRAQDREPVLIALDGETVIGFAGAGASRDDPPVAPRELRAMYVRAAWYGTGLADDLMRAAIPGISRSARQGVATAKRPVPGTALATHSLWVFEENPRAQAFYRKYGFELDGTRRAERFSPAVEVRMVRRAG